MDIACQVRKAVGALFSRTCRDRCADFRGTIRHRRRDLDRALDGEFSFDALQMRFHPAESRIRKLATETPAKLILFDMLADTGRANPGREAAVGPAGTARSVRQTAATSGVELSPFNL